MVTYRWMLLSVEAPRPNFKSWVLLGSRSVADFRLACIAFEPRARASEFVSWFLCSRSLGVTLESVCTDEVVTGVLPGVWLSFCIPSV